MKLRQGCTIVACLGGVLFCGFAHATVLTFDFGGVGTPTNGSLISQDYGDRVTATAMPSVSSPGLIYNYGATGGFTPNVVVAYGNSTVQTDLNFWSTGYNDLVNVVESESDDSNGYAIRFKADLGFNVTLGSFDLGNFSGAVTLPGLSVVNESNVILWQSTGINVPANTVNSHLSFFPNVTGQILLLRVDTTGLNGDADNIGLDNITFSQSVAVVPTPTASLAGSAMLGLVTLAKLRRRRLLRP